MAEEEKGKVVGKKILSYIDKGVAASRKGLETAGKAISDFGDKSVHRIEIAQLKGKQEKTFTALGELVHQKILAGETSVSAADEEIAAKEAEIVRLAGEIEKHEEAIKEIKNAEKEKPAGEHAESEAPVEAEIVSESEDAGEAEAPAEDETPSDGQ